MKRFVLSSTDSQNAANAAQFGGDNLSIQRRVQDTDRPLPPFGRQILPGGVRRPIVGVLPEPTACAFGGKIPVTSRTRIVDRGRLQPTEPTVKVEEAAPQVNTTQKDVSNLLEKGRGLVLRSKQRKSGPKRNSPFALTREQLAMGSTLELPTTSDLYPSVTRPQGCSKDLGYTNLNGVMIPTCTNCHSIIEGNMSALDDMRAGFDPESTHIKTDRNDAVGEARNEANIARRSMIYGTDLLRKMYRYRRRVKQINQVQQEAREAVGEELPSGLQITPLEKLLAKPQLSEEYTELPDQSGVPEEQSRQLSDKHHKEFVELLQRHGLTPPSYNGNWKDVDYDSPANLSRAQFKEQNVRLRRELDAKQKRHEILYDAFDKIKKSSESSGSSFEKACFEYVNGQRVGAPQTYDEVTKRRERGEPDVFGQQVGGLDTDSKIQLERALSNSTYGPTFTSTTPAHYPNESEWAGILRDHINSQKTFAEQLSALTVKHIDERLNLESQNHESTPSTTASDPNETSRAERLQMLREIRQQLRPPSKKKVFSPPRQKS